jgi:signal peptidase I
MKKKKLRKLWKDIWFLLWKDDSLKGWLLSVLVIFILIKFIFFPTLSLVTGTTLPLAIVESCSMYHNENILSNYDNWFETQKSKYSKFNIDKEQFEKFKMKNGFNKGDILFILGANPEKLKVGDIIIFTTGQTNPVIHRIVNIENNKFSTIGDNNQGQLSFEKNISPENIIGKATFIKAPYLGWIKLIFFEFKNPNKGLCN